MQTNKAYPDPAMEALADYRELPAAEMQARARAHYE